MYKNRPRARNNCRKNDNIPDRAHTHRPFLLRMTEDEREHICPDLKPQRPWQKKACRLLIDNAAPRVVKLIVTNLPKGKKMKKSESANRIMRLIFGVCLSVCLVISAVLFILGAVSINRAGDSPYTYASIGAAFKRIVWPVCLTLALALVGGIYFGYIDPRREAVKPPMDAPARLKRAARLADLQAATPARRRLIARERNIRLALRLSNALYFLAGMGVALLCAVNPENYAEGISSAELTASVLGVVLAALIYVTPSAIMALLLIPINALSCQHEMKLLSDLPKRARAPHRIDDSHTPRRFILPCVQLALILLSAVLIALGVANGGMEDVVQKAVKICTECIGLG